MSVPPTLFPSLCDSFWVFQIKVISQLYLATQFENLPTNAFFLSHVFCLERVLPLRKMNRRGRSPWPGSCWEELQTEVVRTNLFIH